MNIGDFILRWRPDGHIDRVEAFERQLKELVEREVMDAVSEYRRSGKVPKGLLPDPPKRFGPGDNLPVGHNIP